MPLAGYPRETSIASGPINVRSTSQIENATGGRLCTGHLLWATARWNWLVSEPTSQA